MLFCPKRKEFFKPFGKIDNQIGNYIRKILRTAVVCHFRCLFIFGPFLCNFTWCLSGLVCSGSYIGANVVTFPVVIAAYLEFGFSVDFGGSAFTL